MLQTEHTQNGGMGFSQLKRACIIEAQSDDLFLTKHVIGLFPRVRMMERTRAIDLRMREDIVLEFRGVYFTEEFAKIADSCGFIFPVPCSMRMSVCKNFVAEHDLSAVIVVLVEQECSHPR